jgi:hypothetical protein
MAILCSPIGRAMWTLAHHSLRIRWSAQSGGRAVTGFIRYWAVGCDMSTLSALSTRETFSELLAHIFNFRDATRTTPLRMQTYMHAS